MVQDFVQTTDDLSSTEWLHRLMSSHSRENEDYEISLMGIFNDIDCHTLFLPATQKKLLVNLSMVCIFMVINVELKVVCHTTVHFISTMPCHD